MQRAQGTPIPTNDLWIAQLARQQRMALQSFDAHFFSVPGQALFPLDQRLGAEGCHCL